MTTALRNDELIEKFKENIGQFLFEPHCVETYEAITTSYNDLISEESDIDDYSVQCNEENNTEEVRNAAGLNLDIAVKFEGQTDWTYFPIRIRKEAE
jgi:hypothetical protein